jgi:hypothetical protein
MNAFLSTLLVSSSLILQYGCNRNTPPDEHLQKQKQEQEMGVDDFREVNHRERSLPFNKSHKVKEHHEIFGDGEAEIDD